MKKFLEASFTISSPPGSNKVTLTRKDTESETVKVIVDAGNPEWIQDEEAGEEEGEREPQDSHVYYTTIVVTKPGKPNQLVVEAFLGAVGGVEVRNVHFAPLDAELESLGHKDGYTGPTYDELDDELKASFEEYVTSLGIDFEFAAAVTQLADHKENQEYLAWLKNVNAYLA